MLQERGALREEDREIDVSCFSFYTDAFWELSTCRQIGMGLGPIPFTSLMEYAKLREVEEIDDFLYVIRVMDNAYLKVTNGNKDTVQQDSRRG